MLKRILIIGAFLGGLAALVFYLVASEEDRLARLTSSTGGQVTEVIVQTDAESDDATTIVHYNYAVAGQVLADQSSKPDDVSRIFPEGTQVTICYDPAEPGETEVYATGQTCPPR
ncbi:DUF3592 domain-containing protein [Brevundimonas sp. TWP2-3-4b1]|uniref:DUF3592 domain-containing protein n=1 Tax=Brevundimonas sp. TWP2-3-4b1 TaxID=2804580 RepID=UPI003CF844FA